MILGWEKPWHLCLIEATILASNEKGVASLQKHEKLTFIQCFTVFKVLSHPMSLEIPSKPP